MDQTQFRNELLKLGKVRSYTTNPPEILPQAKSPTLPSAQKRNLNKERAPQIISQHKKSPSIKKKLPLRVITKKRPISLTRYKKISNKKKMIMTKKRNSAHIRHRKRHTRSKR